MEYEKGSFSQDKFARFQGEIMQARADLGISKDFVELARGRFAQIRAASKGSTFDVHCEFDFAGNVLTQEGKVPRAELAVKQLESKLKLLGEYTKPKRVKTLQSEVEKAKSVELQKRAESELARSKLNRLQAAIKLRETMAGQRKLREALDQRRVAALERAIPIEAQIRTKLEQQGSNEKQDESFQKRIQGLTNSLEASLEQVEIQRTLIKRHDQMVELAVALCNCATTGPLTSKASSRFSNQ